MCNIFFLMRLDTFCAYLSCTTLTTDHQRLVHWLQLTTNIPVGFLGHNEDMWLQLLFKDINSSLEGSRGIYGLRASVKLIAH